MILNTHHLDHLKHLTLQVSLHLFTLTFIHWWQWLHWRVIRSSIHSHIHSHTVGTASGTIWGFVSRSRTLQVSGNEPPFWWLDDCPTRCDSDQAFFFRLCTCSHKGTLTLSHKINRLHAMRSSWFLCSVDSSNWQLQVYNVKINQNQNTKREGMGRLPTRSNQFLSVL